MARITVGITASNNADAHSARRLERTAIADACARFDWLYRDDLARERHRRLKAECVGGDIGKRRASVQHEARSHPVGMGLRIAQDRRRVGKTARQRFPGGDFFVYFDMPRPPMRVLGSCKMGLQRKLSKRAVRIE